MQILCGRTNGAGKELKKKDNHNRREGGCLFTEINIPSQPRKLECESSPLESKCHLQNATPFFSRNTDGPLAESKRGVSSSSLIFAREDLVPSRFY